jgi:phospho-N-acetylmuramoyl-pentapeptide-transferase
MSEITINIIKIFTLATAGFVLAFLVAPFYISFLYKTKAWRKEIRTKSIDGKEIPFFIKFHEKKEIYTPRLGGALIWGSVLLVSFVFFILSYTNIWWFQKLNFLSRSQTWLPLFALIAASLVGLVDDVLQVFGKGKYIGGGLRLKFRLFLVFLIGLIGSVWFYYKLGFETIHVPGMGDFYIGIWYVPFFILVTLAVYSGGVIDGLDGLSGGAFASMFTPFAGIALFRGQIDLASFCLVVTGAILAFLWFNIPPARFYMTETGTMGLCAALTVVAFLTDSVLVLPIIGFLLVIESVSVILQLLSKKFLKKKLFLAAPLHHHFEAKGWPHYKVTMRFWVVGVVMAIIGVTIRLIG